MAQTNKTINMKKRTFTHYYVLSLKDGKEQIVGHSKDEKTGEIYYKFLNRSQAKKLIADEKQVSPEYKYCLRKETQTFEDSEW